MVKRSLQACPSRVHQAKRAFALKGWTQENLAGEVNLKTRQPIWRFFTGQPVERQIFIEICAILDLDWREIAVDPPAEFPELGRRTLTAPLDLDGLVQQVRSQLRDALRDRCGILQLLDLGRPVWIDDIYIDVNLLERVSAQQWCELADLQQVIPDRLTRLPGVHERQQVGTNEQRQQLPGIQAVATYSKLKVLGRPGMGKTMFLKHLAIQCDRGEFAADRVPIFMTLSDFAEASSANHKFALLDYLQQISIDSGVANPCVLETLLQEGRVLLLIDGMDEVAERDIATTLKELRKFSDKYHKNQYVVACRTGARNLPLRGFAEVEIAPFARAQIANFAHKWFMTLADRSPQSGRTLSLQLLQQLDIAENWQLRQLVATPLFLHLACSTFHVQGKFPAQRIDFYARIVNLLMGKWDEAKGVDRGTIDPRLSVSQTLRLLSQLAAATFERGRYSIERREVERYIGDFLRSLPGKHLNAEEIQLESTTILGALETQHGLPSECARGIFSFSAPIFQEYLTARKIVSQEDRGGLERSLRGLVRHLTDPQWHEVFILSAAMLRNADELVQLMRQQIDLLIDREPCLQEFLVWLTQTASLHPARSKSQAVWVQQLKNAVADYQNTHDSWQLNTEREQLLQSYCYANQLLLDCLNGSTEVTPALGQQIAATLLPQKVGSNISQWIPTLISPLRPPQSA